MKIGLEIHCQLGPNVKTKIFCGCPNPANLNTKNLKPNTLTCPTCLGLPGSKPTFNKKVLEETLKIALALNFKINEEMLFSRKVYMYPDLPSSFQITQYETPLGVNGEFQGINLRRIHMEEDPGKLIHENNYTLIDYNRSGTPLVEIVTEPEFKSPEQVRLFLQKLIIILEYLGVYSRKAESSLRVDANISTTAERVEIKNIGSIKDVENALNVEILRQKTDPPKIQQTRGWDQDTQSSILLRTKETEEDYGYIEEANLPKITISKELIDQTKNLLPELADEKTQRFVRQYKIKTEDAMILTSDLFLANLFEKVAKKINYELATRWFIREIPKIINYTKKTIQEMRITENELIELLEPLQNKRITETTAQKTLEKLSLKLFSPKEYIEKENLLAVSSEKVLDEIIKKVIQSNQKAVESYKNGEEKSFNFLVGAVMAKTKGTADPQIVSRLLKEKLKN